MQEIDNLLEVMRQLRQKCPWDAKQTHSSLKRYLLEETYETLEAIESENMDELKKELGDVLLQIVFHCEIASEKNNFIFKDVVNEITAKMIERHPHVFKSEENISAEKVKQNWERNKIKKENRKSILSGVPKSIPALLKAQKYQEKAAHFGFDWTDLKDVWSKLHEEIDELKKAQNQSDKNKVEEELGDLLFTVVNLSRFMKFNSEDALNKSIEKFKKRFHYIEEKNGFNPENISSSSIDELESLWQEAKKNQ